MLTSDVWSVAWLGAHHPLRIIHTYVGLVPSQRDYENSAAKVMQLLDGIAKCPVRELAHTILIDDIWTDDAVKLFLYEVPEKTPELRVLSSR